jgi:hypothetical protein
MLCAPVTLAMLLITPFRRICSEQATWSFQIVHALQKGVAQLHGFFSVKMSDVLTCDFYQGPGYSFCLY